MDSLLEASGVELLCKSCPMAAGTCQLCGGLALCAPGADGAVAWQLVGSWALTIRLGAGAAVLSALPCCSPRLPARCVSDGQQVGRHLYR